MQPESSRWRRKEEWQTVRGFVQEMNWHREQSQNLSIGPLASQDEDLGSIQDEHWWNQYMEATEQKIQRILILISAITLKFIANDNRLIQGVFSHCNPPKKLKYGKPRLGNTSCKKNVFFLPEWGGEGLARIKKYTLYIPLWRPKKMYKLPERRGVMQ